MGACEMGFVEKGVCGMGFGKQLIWRKGFGGKQYLGKMIFKIILFESPKVQPSQANATSTKINTHIPYCRDTLRRSRQSPALPTGQRRNQGEADNLSKNKKAEDSISTAEDTADTMISSEIVLNYLAYSDTDTVECYTVTVPSPIYPSSTVPQSKDGEQGLRLNFYSPSVERIR